jgi:hypothetical protein
MDRRAVLATALLVLFLALLTVTTSAQLRHNLAPGHHGYVPHDPRVAMAR